MQPANPADAIGSDFNAAAFEPSPFNGSWQTTVMVDGGTIPPSVEDVGVVPGYTYITEAYDATMGDVFPWIQSGDSSPVSIHLDGVDTILGD